MFVVNNIILSTSAQDILAAGEQQTDLSGNPILQDVGVWMKAQIKKSFPEADVKYIDPSYLIRSIPTISADRIYCKVGSRLSLGRCSCVCGALVSNQCACQSNSMGLMNLNLLVLAVVCFRVLLWR